MGNLTSKLPSSIFIHFHKLFLFNGLIYVVQKHPENNYRSKSLFFYIKQETYVVIRSTQQGPKKPGDEGGCVGPAQHLSEVPQIPAQPGKGLSVRELRKVSGLEKLGTHSVDRKSDSLEGKVETQALPTDLSGIPHQQRTGQQNCLRKQGRELLSNLSMSI